MEVNTRNIITICKKYMLLIVIMVISVITGYLVFSANTNNITLENVSYANNVNQETDSNVDNVEVVENENNLTTSGLSIDDIINKNKVVIEKIQVEKEEIPFQTIELGASRTGTATVLTKGVNGEKKVTYKVRYEDDVEVNKTEIDNTISKKAVNKVVQYQTATAISRSGDTVSRTSIVADTTAPVSGYSKAIEMKFTSYCLCKKCTGKSPGDKGYGVTASGYKITPGQNQKVVAVDPKVIPLGSKVYVQGLNGMPDYGYAIAADTGGAIKGNKIDLYVDSHGQTPWWTVGKVKVYVL